MKENTKKHLDRLMERYPSLNACRDDIERAFELIAADLASGGKILVCGNGGSAADAQHIVGELMKGFLKSRPLPDDVKRSIEDAGGERGRYIASKLQGALPAIALVGQDAFFTAFANDVDASLVFAQQVYALGNKYDVLIGISTSGNSANVIDALYVAKSVGMDTVGFTGRSGGKMDGICDITIKVPANDTPDVQEFHMPVYHTLCAMLEEELI